MFEAFLLAMFLTMVIVLVTGAVLLGVFSWQLAKSNRVVPDTPGTAPILWLWSPTQPARLHRRLRGAVRVLPLPPPARRTRHGAAAGPHAEMARTVASQAVGIDQQVVVAARLSRQQRRRQLHALTPQVAEIERLSLRLMHQQRQSAQPATIGGSHPQAASTVEVLADVDRRLDRLDDAHRELAAIERESGLLDPDEIIARMAPPRAGAPQPMPLAQPGPGRPDPGRPQHAGAPRPAPPAPAAPHRPLTRTNRSGRPRPTADLDQAIGRPMGAPRRPRTDAGEGLAYGHQSLSKEVHPCPTRPHPAGTNPRSSPAATSLRNLPPAPGYQPPTYQAPPAQPAQPMYQQPAQFQPVNPGASSSGNGCLKAFLIISAISIVLGIIAVVVIVVFVGNAVDELAGTADPSDYKIEIEDCTISEFGLAEATGTITNVDSKSHGFIVNVDFTEEGSTTRAGGSLTYVNSLSSNQSGAWTVTSSVTGDPTAISCAVSSVEYAL